MKTQNCIVLSIEAIEEMVSEKLKHINGIETIEVFIYDYTELEVIISLSMDDKNLARQVVLSLGIKDLDDVYEGDGVIRIFGKNVMKMLPIEYNGIQFYTKLEPCEICFTVEETNFTQKLMKLIVLATGQVNIPLPNEDSLEDYEDERMDVLHDVEYTIDENVIELMKINGLNKDDVTDDTLTECIWEILCDIY